VARDRSQMYFSFSRVRRMSSIDPSMGTPNEVGR
jgi:hypothetical protein